MIEYIKSKFRRPTPLEVISRELAEAHLHKLEAETAVDYAKSVVDYNMTMIKRLNLHIAQYTKETK
jgi:hypothetical protein